MLTAYQLKQFDYRYDDTDTIMNELSEFYPYLEMPGIVENAEKFKQHFNARKSLDPCGNALQAIKTDTMARLDRNDVPQEETIRGRTAGTHGIARVYHTA